MKILGIDPSLSNCGFATGTLDIETLDFKVDNLNLVKTEASKSKTTRKNSDDLERCRLLAAGLREAEKGAEIAFVEMPVGSQSARAMMSYGVCMQLVGMLNIPVIQVTPNEVKTAATGDKLATKREMIEWASFKFPDLNWLKKGGRLIDANEHLADAIGAINAGVHNEEFLALISMLRSMSRKTAA